MLHLFEVAEAGVISDAPSISHIILNVLNFLLQIFGIFAIISLVVSGVMYFLAAGNEELAKKAKKAALNSIIGVAVGLGGMILVKTLTSIIK